jgi:hypothetical protein
MLNFSDNRDATSSDVIGIPLARIISGFQRRNSREPARTANGSQPI